jgi:hypothetical protein
LPAQLQQAADLIASRPDVQLYVYGRAFTDLNFLTCFAALRRLHVALYDLDDITGFSHVPRLEELTFGETKKNLSLRFIGALPRLKRLFLVEHKQDLPCIGDLGELTDLGLNGAGG